VDLSFSRCGWMLRGPLFLAALALGCGGSSNSTVVSTPIPPPPSAPSITSFAATPNDITLGQTTTLTWQVSGATSLQLDGMTVLPSSSSFIVVPADTTTYTLTATNSVGTIQQGATVTVTAGTAIASMQINPAGTTQVIPSNFLSIAQDLSETTTIVGTSSSNMNTIYEQLLKNILQYGNGPLLIRLLADGNYLSSTNANDLSALSQLNTDLGAQYIVGVDFVDDDLSTATEEASLLAAGLPGAALQGFETGNEPDGYEANYSAYLTEYQQFAPAIIAASGGVRMAAPVWAGYASFMPNLNSFISTEASTLAIVDLHYYPGSDCNGGTEPADFLLTDAAVNSDSWPTSPVGIQQYLPTAQGAGIPVRIGELNSISCGGQAGVSNSFSSALWAMDIAFSYANEGAGGINFFAPGSTNTTHPYTPFDFTYTVNSNGTQNYSVRDINPLYYGMMMFAQTVRNGAHLLPVPLTTTANIKAWTTIDANRTIRLLLLNKDQAASGPVSIALNGYGQATVTRLLAPSYSSITGVTLGGQTFDGSGDGTPQGTAYTETIQPNAGTYTVALPSVSAALVTIQP
jgi:hypothetical protein